jgi:hypothetical protein
MATSSRRVLWSGPDGLVFAQNMMYRHNVLVFDQFGVVVAKIDDSVDLQDFGLSEDRSW